MFATSGRNLAEFLPKRPTLGQHIARIAQIWPKFGQGLHTAAKISLSGDAAITTFGSAHYNPSRHELNMIWVSTLLGSCKDSIRGGGWGAVRSTYGASLGHLLRDRRSRLGFGRTLVEHAPMFARRPLFHPPELASPDIASCHRAETTEDKTAASATDMRDTGEATTASEDRTPPIEESPRRTDSRRPPPYPKCVRHRRHPEAAGFSEGNDC